MTRQGRQRTWGAMLIAVGLAIDAAGAVARVDLDLSAGAPCRYAADYPVGRAELAAGGDRVVGVEIEANSLLMMPLQEGRATLFVFDQADVERDRIEIVVSRTRTPGPLDEAVRALLVDAEGNPIPGLTASALPGTQKVRLTGRLADRRAWAAVARVRGVFGEAVADLTEIDPAFGETIAAEVRSRMANGNIEVVFAGRELFLRGLAGSDTEKAYLEAAARAVYPEVRSFLAVKPWKSAEMPQDVVLERPLLLLECQLVEITLETLREMGVDWGGGQSIQLQAGWSAAAGAGGAVSSVSMATARLFDLLLPHVQSGDARVLYTQNLVCEDGASSRFFAGGSFHLVAQEPDGDGVVVKEIEYGIGMNLEPRLDRYGNLETKVAIEFSSLGPVIGLYPSLLKRYVRTSVNVKQGQTLSLGALIGHTATEDVSKIPGLGDIPVLGELFRSERYRKKQSELVILITPRRIVPGSPEEAALRNGMREKAEQEEP